VVVALVYSRVDDDFFVQSYPYRFLGGRLELFLGKSRILKNGIFFPKSLLCEIWEFLVLTNIYIL